MLKHGRNTSQLLSTFDFMRTESHKVDQVRPRVLSASTVWNFYDITWLRNAFNLEPTCKTFQTRASATHESASCITSWCHVYKHHCSQRPDWSYKYRRDGRGKHRSCVQLLGREALRLGAHMQFSVVQLFDRPIICYAHTVQLNGRSTVMSAHMQLNSCCNDKLC
jgi:hypothetical protein